MSPKTLSLLLVSALSACTAGTLEDPGLADGDTKPRYAPASALDPSLRALVDRMAAEAAWRSPGTEIGLAVHDLKTGERASVNGGVLHITASTGKLFWVAAALDRVGISPIAADAVRIFEYSNNDASARVVAQATPNGINDYQRGELGMTSTAFTMWGSDLVATNSPRAMGDENYSTADDSILFLAKLRGGQALDASRTSQLLSWMLLSPDSGPYGAVGERLPSTIRNKLRHKVGILTPDVGYDLYNDVGLMELAADHHVAYAIYVRGGSDYWWAQKNYFQYVACEVYRHASGQASFGCHDSDVDPEPPAGGTPAPTTPSDPAPVACGQDICDYEWCGKPQGNACPERWRGTGDGCDCGCQWFDPDCGVPDTGATEVPDDTAQGAFAGVYCTTAGGWCGGQEPCWPATSCPPSSTCDWANGTWGACRYAP